MTKTYYNDIKVDICKVIFVQMQSFKKVVEASYLTAEKAWSYLNDSSLLYIQHERMREFLFPEEIYAYLKKLPEIADYT